MQFTGESQSFLFDFHGFCHRNLILLKVMTYFRHEKTHFCFLFFSKYTFVFLYGCLKTMLSINKRNFLYKLGDILNKLLMILLLYFWGRWWSVSGTTRIHIDIINFDDDEFFLKWQMLSSFWRYHHLAPHPPLLLVKHVFCNIWKHLGSN